jgi:hypothetical protein
MREFFSLDDSGSISVCHDGTLLSNWERMHWKFIRRINQFPLKRSEHWNWHILSSNWTQFPIVAHANNVYGVMVHSKNERKKLFNLTMSFQRFLSVLVLLVLLSFCSVNIFHRIVNKLVLTLPWVKCSFFFLQRSLNVTIHVFLLSG